jgi:hypothetical protein
MSQTVSGADVASSRSGRGGTVNQGNIIEKTNKLSLQRSRNNKRLNKINTSQKRFVWDKQTT